MIGEGRRGGGRSGQGDWPPSPQQVIRRGTDVYLGYDLDADGRLDYLQRLRQGYKDQLYFSPQPGAPPTRIVARPATRLSEGRLLLLLLDGVAYQRVQNIYQAGRFRLFYPPARLISVFPTLTDPAYDLLFGTGPTPGYEAGHFDRRANRRTAAFRAYLRGANEAWVRRVDYRLSFLRDAVMYLLPRWVYRSELRRARRVLDRCLAAGARQVALYILSTDALGHRLPPDRVERELARLDDWIERLVYDTRGELEVVMLADHGLGVLPEDCSHLFRFDLRGVLRAAGLRVVKRLTRPGDVVLPLFGLLDMARLHTFDAPTRRRAVAALRSREEIELVAERDGRIVNLYSGPAEGQLARRDGANGPLYRYRPIVGDPLRLGQASARLCAAGELNGDGFASAAAWQAATADLPFPAAPQRLWGGLFSLSEEQPDIVVSLNERWYVGSGLFSRLVRLRGTHGGLHRRVSETFAMTTALQLPSPTDLAAVGEILRREYGWCPGSAGRVSPVKAGWSLGVCPGER